MLEIVGPQVFLSFTSSGDSALVPFVSSLGHTDHFKPYDFGLITLIFDQIKMPEVPAPLCPLRPLMS